MLDGQRLTCTLKRRQEEEEEEKEIISIYNKLLKEVRKSKRKKGEEEDKNGQERALILKCKILKMPERSRRIRRLLI